MRSKQIMEPRFAEMSMDEMVEKAALELMNSPAIFALLCHINQESISDYDTASSMEQVSFIRGKRFVCNMFLEIEAELDGQKISHERILADLKSLDMG